MKQSILATLVAMSAMAGVAHATGMKVTVYKTPWCGCCEAWSKAIEEGGYTVATHDMEDLSVVRKSAGVPTSVEGCHTAELDGYFLEGHVPLEAIRKLVTEKPAVAGLSVPGMPAGSLGMGGDPSARYDVVAVKHDGTVAPYLSVAN